MNRLSSLGISHKLDKLCLILLLFQIASLLAMMPSVSLLFCICLLSIQIEKYETSYLLSYIRILICNMCNDDWNIGHRWWSINVLLRRANIKKRHIRSRHTKNSKTYSLNLLNNFLPSSLWAWLSWFLTQVRNVQDRIGLHK